jgi:1,2-dihydroxy-3-keto-5-methylthiopentene dioxygenase
MTIMAKLTPLWTQNETSNPEVIRPFLAEEGIDFSVWDLPAEVVELAAKARLTDTEKMRILDIFQTEISDVATSKGYVDADVIAIRSDLPGIDEALAKFDKVHYHDDDEVRAIVGGRGVFGFIMNDGRQFILEIEAGEFISVPAGMWHWFYCHEDRNITALRLFKDTTGWTPHYRQVTRGVTNSQ